jgi:hypothetical protein
LYRSITGVHTVTRKLSVSLCVFVRRASSLNGALFLLLLLIYEQIVKNHLL